MVLELVRHCAAVPTDFRLRGLCDLIRGRNQPASIRPPGSGERTGGRIFYRVQRHALRVLFHCRIRQYDSRVMHCRYPVSRGMECPSSFSPVQRLAGIFGLAVGYFLVYGEGLFLLVPILLVARDAPAAALRSIDAIRVEGHASHRPGEYLDHLDRGIFFPEGMSVKGVISVKSVMSVRSVDTWING